METIVLPSDTPFYSLGVSPDVKKGADALMAELVALPWLEVTPARKEYFMSDRPRSYAYKVRGDDGPGTREYQSSDYSPIALRMLGALNLLFAGKFNVCFLNRYDTQHNQLGWHADDSPEMDHDHPIAVISLGAEREIWWKPKDHKGDVPPEWRQKLGHGSMFVMPPGFQRTHLHRIPRCDRKCDMRISLTFRRYIDKEQP